MNAEEYFGEEIEKMSNYKKIKAKAEKLTPDNADAYVLKMYNATLLTPNDLARLDGMIFCKRLELGEYD